MTGEDCKKVELVAEVTVQRFFTHYLEVIFPQQLTAAITAHNKDVTAHKQQIEASASATTARFKLWIAGLILALGLGGGVGIAKAVAAIIGS